MHIKKRCYLFVLLLLLLQSCSKSDNLENEKIGIGVSANEVSYNEMVTFTMENVNAADIASVRWDFGDGKTSAERAPKHAYALPDDYTVMAYVSFVSGEKKTHKTIIKVTAEEVEASVRLSIPASLKESRYQVCAHRGYWKEAPENSILAIEKAILNKIDYIEIDVRMTKDGKLVLMHNSTIDKVTNGTGKVAGLTYDEIASFYMYHGTELTTERVPLLSEALMSARGKIYVDIDMKISDYRAVYEVVKKCGMLSQAMFTVYEVPNAAKLVNIDKEVNVFPVIYSMEELDQYMSLVKNLSIVQFNPRTWKDEILNKAYNNGIAGFMNVYINSDETPAKDNYRKVDEFVKLGGTVVQTDFPVELKTYLDKLIKN